MKITQIHMGSSLGTFKWVNRNSQAFQVGVLRLIVYHIDYTTGSLQKLNSLEVDPACRMTNHRQKKGLWTNVCTAVFIQGASS